MLILFNLIKIFGWRFLKLSEVCRVQIRKYWPLFRWWLLWLCLYFSVPLICLWLIQCHQPTGNNWLQYPIVSASYLLPFWQCCVGFWWSEPILKYCQSRWFFAQLPFQKIRFWNFQVRCLDELKRNALMSSSGRWGLPNRWCDFYIWKIKPKALSILVVEVFPVFQLNPL